MDLPIHGSLLAVRGDGTILAAAPGDDVLQLGDGTTIEAGGLVGGLCAEAWALTTTSRVVFWDGSVVSTEPFPQLVQAGDLDGDGDIDVAVNHPGIGSVGILSGDGEVIDPSAGVERSLNVGDVGLACPVFATVDDETLSLWRDASCVDGDGDGYLASSDCDDADPSVHPDAADECDGIDNNCDGLVDGPVDLLISLNGILKEGGEAWLVATDPTCGHAVSLTLSGDRAGDCTGDTCTWTDNGTLTVHADALSGSASREFTIDNVAPRLTADGMCGCGCDACLGDYVGTPGERLVVTLATDVADDNLLCSLSEPVPGLLLDGCTATWEVSEGSWHPGVDAWDKEGAHTSRMVSFVGDADDSACAPVGARSGLGVLVGMLLARRGAHRRGTMAGPRGL